MLPRQRRTDRGDGIRHIRLLVRSPEKRSKRSSSARSSALSSSSLVSRAPRSCRARGRYRRCVRAAWAHWTARVRYGGGTAVNLARAPERAVRKSGVLERRGAGDQGRDWRISPAAPGLRAARIPCTYRRGSAAHSRSSHDEETVAGTFGRPERASASGHCPAVGSGTGQGARRSGGARDARGVGHRSAGASEGRARSCGEASQGCAPDGGDGVEQARGKGFVVARTAR